MRPIQRGAWPVEGKERVSFTDYKEARPILGERVGWYCCYCEIPISNCAELEHVVSKDKWPGGTLSWYNFLLSCKNCNTTKKVKIAKLGDRRAFYLPHKDAAFGAFVFSAEGRVAVTGGLSPEERARARATAEMVGLFKHPGSGLNRQQLLTGSDRRYQERSNAWRRAVDARDGLRRCPMAVMEERIVAEALSVGFFSIWMAVFRDLPRVRGQLIAAFPGTSPGRIR